MKYVLSIDGGGMRGIIPARVLAEIERRTGAPTSQHFDLLVGTSTGGLLTLGLTRPGEAGAPRYRAGDIVTLYEKEGPVIFQRPRNFLMRLARPKYRSKNLSAVLKDYFGASALSSALSPVMVTTYDTQHTDPYLLKSWKPRMDCLMWEAAYATSAVPTYFPPLKLDGRTLIDGGIYAENPAACALAEARRLWPEEDVVLVSLGTGNLERPRSFEEVRRWGLVRWTPTILDLVFDGSNDTVDYIVRQLLPAAHYFRFETELPVDAGAMDDASAEHVEQLHALAEHVLEVHGSRMDLLCDHLRRRREVARNDASSLT